MLRFDGIDDKLAAPPAPVIVSDRFPSETHHGRRFIASLPAAPVVYDFEAVEAFFSIV